MAKLVKFPRPGKNFCLYCNSTIIFYADSQQNKNDLQAGNDEDGAEAEPQYTNNGSTTLPHVKEGDKIQSEGMTDGMLLKVLLCTLTFVSWRLIQIL